MSVERKHFRNLTRLIGEYNVLFECLLGCSETYCRNMFTIISDIEREKLLKQWLGISMNIEDISKRPLTKFCQDILKQARMEYGREKKN